MKWASPREVADRIIFMADGEVLVDTTDVDDFFDNPSEPRAQTIPQAKSSNPRKVTKVQIRRTAL